MITVTGKNKTVTIPNKWEELSQDEFVATVSLLRKFLNGEMELQAFRMQLLAALSGYKRKKRHWRMTPEKEEMINYNLLQLSERLNFVLKPAYANEDIFDMLSPETGKALRNNFPEDIFDEDILDEIRPVQHHLEAKPEVNYNIRKNPMQTLYIDSHFYGSITWQVDENGVAMTNMNAGEFLDMQEYYRLFLHTNNEQYIDHLISVMYGHGQQPYSSIRNQERAGIFQLLSPAIKSAILFVYQCMMHYFQTIEPYFILFSAPDVQTEEHKLSAGAQEAVYSLAKEYGSVQEMFNMPVGDYLNLLVKQITDGVKMMRDMKKKEHEIAKELKLKPEILQRI